MDRALDPELLGAALGDIENLPSPQELRATLAEAEVSAFFAQDDDLPTSLVNTAWVLHQVGTVRPALQLYEPERQAQANAVAAHIFDLALARGSEIGERLIMTFAAQVSSIRGDRTPNATALAARLPPLDASIMQSPGRASLEVGCSLLSLTRVNTFRLLRRLRAELRGANRLDEASSAGTPIAAAVAVVNGSWLLLQYLADGDDGDLARARDIFERGANDDGARRDFDSRWVAAHLLDLVDDLGNSSVWAILPPDSPRAVGRAMTLGDPPVLTLWPPQVALLRDDEHTPLRADARRAVITFPTSAGKTLMTQLVIAHHLATAGTPVCVVAPSHSLCREIRLDLDRRLLNMRTSVREDGPLGHALVTHEPVIVMTPERLAARLRLDAGQLLADFGLFVLDEAHLVGDESRGWTFETTVSRLHELTLETDHRIVAVSAALGGTASVRTWLGVADPPSSVDARWRGPRRLHATYDVQPIGEERVEPAEGRQRYDRRIQELWGVVSLYVDAGEAVAVRGVHVGDIVRFGKTVNKPNMARRLSPLVNHAAEAGPVLTVHATKARAEALARELAEGREEVPTNPHIRLVERRLGVEHPLVDTLRKGIAYHHAALPVDIKIEVENAVRSRQIEVVCSTTTLTEGVNLPVRTVIVADRGFYDGNNSTFVNLIDAPGLLNAAGRAGRAGRETEGWVIVAQEPQASAPRARSALLALDQHQDVRSRLNTESALEALDFYESLVAETTGVLLEHVPDEVDDFLAFCWYLADASGALDPAARAEAVVNGLRRTLAWQQLPDVVVARWEDLARKLTVTYEATEISRRRRWATSGTRLSSNLVLEQVASSAATRMSALSPEQTTQPLPVLDALLGEDDLAALLALLPARDTRFKRRRYGTTELVDVDVRNLIFDWVRGADLSELTDRYMSEIDEADGFRFEQLTGFVARVCEHHLPWTIGIILSWVQQDVEREFCPSLPTHIHYGAASEVALTLMLEGVRSRRLAVTISERAERDQVNVENLREWLVQFGVEEWRVAFEAASAEVADLLQFVRDRSAGIAPRLLDGEEVDVPCSLDTEVLADGDVSIVVAPTEEGTRTVVVVNSQGETCGQLAPSVLHELRILAEAGFQVLGTHSTRDGQPTLTLHRSDE